MALQSLDRRIEVLEKQIAPPCVEFIFYGVEPGRGVVSVTKNPWSEAKAQFRRADDESEEQFLARANRALQENS